MSLEDLTPEARDELALLAKQLSENPETRKDFLRQVKKVKPEMPIPELEIEDYTRHAVERQMTVLLSWKQGFVKRMRWMNSTSVAAS
jgi:hypothetical protein